MPTAIAPSGPGWRRGASRLARPLSISSAITVRHIDTNHRIGFGSSPASSSKPAGVETAQPPITQRSERQSTWRQTLGSKWTVLSNSMARNAGTTWAGGNKMLNAPMPTIDEPKPDKPRTTKASSVAAAIQASVARSNPSSVVTDSAPAPAPAPATRVRCQAFKRSAPR